MGDVTLAIPWEGKNTTELEPLLTREWLVTNGLGGYASGTLGGAVTRRYHGLLIAALPAPLGRYMMLNHLFEYVRLPDGRLIPLGGEERTGGILKLHGAPYLTGFSLELGLPVWRYNVQGFVIEKRIVLPHMQNTVHVTYRLLEGEGTVRLKLRPSINVRPHEAPASHTLPEPSTITSVEDRLEIATGASSPTLRMRLSGGPGTFTIDGKKINGVFYRLEARRGYESIGNLWSPGYFAVSIGKTVNATLIASTEPWETILALTPEEAGATENERRTTLVSSIEYVHTPETVKQLVLAADQFIVAPAGRTEEAARARAAGDDVRTVVAGYHWFTDWGRDTMISLEGLTLATGRHTEAGWILRTFAHYVRDGLIPNMFPEGEKEGLYHTADATLWLFHALKRYLDFTNDRQTLRLILPKLAEIIEHHLRGTRFGIGIDAADGLLRQGAPGYQLTWMDAKVGEWVVTPRRGKAVELNALWYNALKLAEQWAMEELSAGIAEEYAGHAEQASQSFNARFWHDEGGYLYDIIDGESGDDTACRPNQLFAISLDYPILEQARWQPVLTVVEQRLLTPVGLRSLAPGHPDYRPTYDGDLRARDAAYHQGTVWAWLIGPFIDAWLKVHPDDKEEAHRFLRGFIPHLGEACIGSISEIFDAEEPYTPRGCIAQAWSVAEVLRCWRKIEG